jgi:uncharacterized protein (DUF849 family)
MITRKQKTVLTCAITGAVTSKEQTPYLPITPEQIATSALEAAEAGAAVVHLHVRDPATGAASVDLELYKETFNLIRKENDRVIINLTTGAGAKFIPEPVRMTSAMQGSVMLSARTRIRHILELKPEICSLDFNTMNEGDQKRIRLNMPSVVKDMLKMIQSVGTKPELEIFGSGDFFLAREFEAQGLFTTGKPLWQFATGVKYGIMPTAEAIHYYHSMLPDNALWSAFGIGREEMPMVATTWLYGGHVRVGIEDNVYLEKGVLAEKNSQLVEKAVRIIKDLGGEIANYEEAREIYDLKR